MYLENGGQRSVARLLGVVHQSVANWVNRYADNLSEPVDALDPATGLADLAPAGDQPPAAPARLEQPLVGDQRTAQPTFPERKIVIEVDELYSFIGKKKRKSTSLWR